MLNRSSPVPLYRQLTDLLEGRIAGGDLSPDDWLPTEGELADTYGVHRLTVRQALADLARRGLISTVHGKGSFVSRPTIRYEVGPGHEASFTRAMRAADRVVELRPLRSGTDTDPDVRAALGTRGQLRRYDALRVVDDVPWSVSTTWLPARRFPGLDRHWRGDTSLYEVLAGHYGVHLVRQSRTFAATAAGALEAEQLMVPLGAPVLLVRGLNVDEEGHPVAVVEHRFRGDRVEFTVELA
nr:phosphonate metabolism transcriptional regulator PhnF [Streptomyces sp. NBC_00830]